MYCTKVGSCGGLTAHLSTSTFKKIRFVYLLARLWKTGAIILHGPHHVAVKSTTTYKGQEVEVSTAAQKAGW
jgi:hypothetical protein